MSSLLEGKAALTIRMQVRHIQALLLSDPVQPLLLIQVNLLSVSNINIKIFQQGKHVGAFVQHINICIYTIFFSSCSL